MAIQNFESHNITLYSHGDDPMVTRSPQTPKMMANNGSSDLGLLGYKSLSLSNREVTFHPAFRFRLFTRSQNMLETPLHCDNRTTDDLHAITITTQIRQGTLHNARPCCSRWCSRLNEDIRPQQLTTDRYSRRRRRYEFKTRSMHSLQRFPEINCWPQEVCDQSAQDPGSLLL